MMSWNYSRSLDRIRDHRDSIGEISIEKLVRGADLQQLLTETRCREIYGAHMYLTISNFAHLASNTSYGEDDYKRMIQGLHIYQREVSRIIEGTVFDGLRVHFQGPKVHVLFYRPIDNGEELATHAFFAQLVLKDFVRSVFNPSFPYYDDFEVAGGADIGDVIGTRNGQRSDRELLFLGAPANYAAKIIGTSGSLRLTSEIYDALPEDLQELCWEFSEGVYQISSLKEDELDELLDEYGLTWNASASERRVKADKEAFPLKDISYSSANALIDFDSLSIKNNKRVIGASLFADIAGFTSYIDAAETTEDQRVALEVLHVIRKEMSAVVKRDFDGVRVQFQGDRIQALFHLPKDDEEAISISAVEAAIGLQSSMERTIKEVLPEASELSLAVGIDLGETLVSKLGTRAHRDRICLGEAVEGAASNEERCNGAEIGISEDVYELLPERLSQHFAFVEKTKCYLAEGLTAEKEERAQKAAAYAGGGPVFIKSRGSNIEISSEESYGARAVRPSSSWSQSEEA
jgi:class 3 adenylate cyclase